MLVSELVTEVARNEGFVAWAPPEAVDNRRSRAPQSIASFRRVPVRGVRASADVTCRPMNPLKREESAFVACAYPPFGGY
jgi:hypothetical protein